MPSRITPRQAPTLIPILAVVADCKMYCGVFCLLPGQVVVLKLFIQDSERQSATPRV